MTTESLNLFLEGASEACEVLVEESANGKEKEFYIQGTFAQANAKNRNGRIYHTNVLAEAIANYNKTFVVTNRAVGELGHPPTPIVNYDKVSHIITELKADGDNYIGKARILSTPMGQIVKTFIQEGVQLSVSTRGLGALKKEASGLIVQPGFRLSAVDIVADPSAPECFVNGLMEGTSYVFDAAAGSWVAEQVLEEAVAEIHKTPKPTDAQISRIIQSFVVSLAPTHRNS